MGKYTIKHTCGHDEDVELFGPMDMRNREIERAERLMCPACEARRAQVEDAADGLVPLQGTNKQILFAADVRRAVLDDLRSIWTQDGKLSRSSDASKFVVPFAKALGVEAIRWRTCTE